LPTMQLKTIKVRSHGRTILMSRARAHRIVHMQRRTEGNLELRSKYVCTLQKAKLKRE